MWMIYTVIGLGIALALVALYLLSCIRILNEYQRGVIFRLGRAMPKPKGPGLVMVFSPVDSMVRVDLRTIAKVISGGGTASVPGDLLLAAAVDRCGNAGLERVDAQYWPGDSTV